MLTPTYLKAKFSQGLSYDAYLKDATHNQLLNWQHQYERLSLTPPQRTLLAGFTRQMNVLVTSGTWCGDCAQQVPMLAHIAAGSIAINLRLLDRDEHSDLSQQIQICGGLRVPTAMFLNEDFDFVSILGDKTLSRLRSQAAKSLGAFCQLAGAEQPADLAAATLADWLAEFERVQLLLRLSPKLRARHGD